MAQVESNAEQEPAPIMHQTNNKTTLKKKGHGSPGIFVFVDYLFLAIFFCFLAFILFKFVGF